MSNITKVLAEQLTTELLKQRQEKVNEAEKELQLAVSESYKSTLPKEVLAFFNSKHSHYMQTISHIYLIGNGLNHNRVILDNVLPKESGVYNFVVPSKHLSKIVSLVNKEIEVREKLKHDQKVIKATILSLRTFAKVKEAFPEIAHLLKEEPKTLLVNIQQVRKLLK